MKKKQYILIFAMIISLQSLFAQKFNAVCSSGQNVYYSITSSIYPFTVGVVSPNGSAINPYSNSDKPKGDLVIPAHVVYKGITYTVTSIQPNAFMGCSSLTSVTLPNTIESIGESAFDACSNIGSVVLGKSVTSIGNEAFFGCRNLISIVLEATNPPLIYNSTFSGVPSNVKVIVPESALSLYKEFSTWSSFQNIVESANALNSTIEQNILQTSQPQVIYLHDTITLTKVIHDTVYVHTDCPPSKIAVDTIYQDRIVRRIDTLEVVRLVHDTVVTIQRENIYINQPAEVVKTPEPEVAQAPVTTEPTKKEKNKKEPQPTTLTKPETPAEPETPVAQNKVETPQPTPQEPKTTYYRLSVVSSNDDYGKVEGSGRYASNAKVDIKAKANKGYHFKVWSDGVSQNPRTISVTDNHLYIAVFDVDEVPVAKTENVIPEIFVNNKEVVINGTPQQEVNIYDTYGRVVLSEVTQTQVSKYVLRTPGSYVVQVGEFPSQRIYISE